MGRRKLEKKLLQAAAVGSLKRVKRVMEKAQTKKKHRRSYSTGTSNEDTDEEMGKKGKGKEEGTKRKCSSSRRENASSSDKKRRRGSSSERCNEAGRGARETKHRCKLNVNCLDFDGWTPLHHAAFFGAEDVVEYLLNHGAEATAVDVKENTPLHIAARKGFGRIIAALRNAGGDMEVENSAGETPAMIVRQKLVDMHSKPDAARFEERLEDEKEGWGVWGDEADEASGHGFMSGAAKGWDWFGEERAHQAGLSSSRLEEPAEDQDDAWKDEVAEEMARRSRKSARDGEDAFLENARREWQEMKQKRKAKERESQKILEEEERKDKAWREGVFAGGVVDARKKYEQEWSAFAKSSMVGITVGDIPFPVVPGKEASLKDMLLVGVPSTEQRKRIREEVLRWHPDKFMQHWGKRLMDRERDAIAARVKEISQAIQDVYFSLDKQK